MLVHLLLQLLPKDIHYYCYLQMRKIRHKKVGKLPQVTTRLGRK